MRPEAILARVDARREELLALLDRLVRTPSINPGGDERAVADLLGGYLRSVGLGDQRVLAKAPERPNLVVRLRGRKPGPVLMLSGHMDTKPVGEDAAHLWRTDPFTPVLEEGRLYGLGTADMKGAVAAMAVAAAVLAEADAPLAGDLLLVFTADEEAGGRLGARYLSEEADLRADAGLVGEPCGVARDWEALCLAARGTLGFRTRVHGTQAHSSLSDRLPVTNAVQKMAAVLDRMAREFRVEMPPHPYYPAGVTHNIGVTVDGGVFYGVVPGRAEFRSDLRLPPGITAAEAWRQVNAFVERLRREDPGLRIDLVRDLPAGADDQAPIPEVPPDEPLVGSVLRAASTVLGQPPPLGGFPGATDAFDFHARAGIPTIPSFGPGLLTVCHGPNEYVAVESVVQAAKIYALAAFDYLGGGRR
ncbi:MAG TPA: M20 family metallopeptidase [Thermodesulfobacteriota bacterium]